MQIELVSRGHILGLVSLTEIFKARLKTQTALLQLTKFLIAQAHIVEKRERVGLVSAPLLQVHYVEHAVRFLKQCECLFILLSIDELDGRAVQLDQNERNFLLCDF